MGFLIQLFTVDELKSLDLKQIEILRDAIRNELRTSAQVTDAIRSNVRAVYDNLKRADPAQSPPKTP